MPQTHPGSVDDTPSTEEQFLDLLLANEKLLRVEFDAIIARGVAWPATEPPSPTRLRRAGPRREAPIPSRGDRSAWTRTATKGGWVGAATLTARRGPREDRQEKGR